MNNANGKDDEDHAHADATTANSSNVSASSAGGDQEIEGEEDVAKRRSKNRVNARRSRERKRLMLDTLQQEHWQLHQENKRIKMDNEKLREAIKSIKTLQSGGAMPQHSMFPNNIPSIQMSNVPPSSSTHNSNNNSHNHNNNSNSSSTPHPSNVGNPFMELLAQQMLGQQQISQGNNPGGSMNPMLTQFLLANILHNAGGGYNSLTNPNVNNQQSHQPQQAQQQQHSSNNLINSSSYTTQARQDPQEIQNSSANVTPSGQLGGNGDDGGNMTNINGGQPPNFASLLQQLGGALPNSAILNPLMNQANASGLASILQALGQQPQQQQPQQQQQQQQPQQQINTGNLPNLMQLQGHVGSSNNNPSLNFGNV